MSLEKWYLDSGPKYFAWPTAANVVAMLQTAATKRLKSVTKIHHGHHGNPQTAPVHELIARAFGQADSCNASGLWQTAPG